MNCFSHFSLIPFGGPDVPAALGGYMNCISHFSLIPFGGLDVPAALGGYMEGYSPEDADTDPTFGPDDRRYAEQ